MGGPTDITVELFFFGTRQGPVIHGPADGRVFVLSADVTADRRVNDAS